MSPHLGIVVNILSFGHWMNHNLPPSHLILEPVQHHLFGRIQVPPPMLLRDPEINANLLPHAVQRAIHPVQDTILRGSKRINLHHADLVAAGTVRYILCPLPLSLAQILSLWTGTKAVVKSTKCPKHDTMLSAQVSTK